MVPEPPIRATDGEPGDWMALVLVPPNPATAETASETVLGGRLPALASGRVAGVARLVVEADLEVIVRLPQSRCVRWSCRKRSLCKELPLRNPRAHIPCPRQRWAFDLHQKLDVPILVSHCRFGKVHKPVQ